MSGLGPMEVQHITEAYHCSCNFFGISPVCLLECGPIVIDQLLVLVTFFDGQDLILGIHVVCGLYFLLLTMPQ